MSRRGECDLGKERFWRRQLKQWRRSGLTIREYCAEHGLSEPSLYSWRRVIAARDQERSAVRAGRARREPGDGRVKEAPAFVPVHVVAPLAAPALEIVLHPGRVVRVPSGFDAATLRQLLAVLEEPSC